MLHKPVICGKFVIPPRTPRIGESEFYGDRARIMMKISNPSDRHQFWYVIESDPDGAAFGWVQTMRDCGNYANFDLKGLSEIGMEQSEIGMETVRSMREHGLIG